MKKTTVSVVLCALTLLLLGLAGCGGDNSTPEEAPAAVFLNGVVEDGPIENVTITLRDAANSPLSLCGPQWSDPCETKTNAAGAFSLAVKAGTQLANLGMVAGGIDFVGPEFRTPLALYSDDLTKIVISPLTTVVTELRDQGLSLSVAQDRVRVWLDLPTATNLALSSGSSPEMKRRAYLLREISLEINTMQTFVRIGAEIVKQDAALLADSTCNQNVMQALGLDFSAQTRIAQLQIDLVSAQTVESIDDAALSYKRKEMMAFFDASVKQMLVDSASFDPLNANYRENLRILTEATLQVAGSRSIPLGGTIPQRIVRYILFTYFPDANPLDTNRTLAAETFLLDTKIFSASLQMAGVPLKNDPRIVEIARSRSLYNVISPLLLTELPGNNNQQRLAYFYGSDLSPHYLAEQLIGRVFDDAINDAVLLKIVEGKANAGLVDETRAIIATQIVQSEPKANAYRTLANALISFGRMAEARGELIRAWNFYIAVIESKGKASASSTDAFNLYATSSSFRKAGDLAAAQQVLDYLAEVATALSSSSDTFGRLITGIRDVATDYITAGDLVAAAPLVEAMYVYALQMPSDISGSITTYTNRVFHLRETAMRYADLGNRTMVLQIYGQIQTLRSVDGYQNLTGAETWPWIHGLVEILYRVGETQEALTLANSIPASYVNAAGLTRSGLTYQANAFKFVATYEAMQGSLDQAFNIVDQYLSKKEDKIDALTYFASNKGAEYIGLALISAGRFAEARRALEKAEGVLSGMIQSTDPTRYTYLVKFGYVKLADLYFMIGDSVKAEELLQLAKSEADKIVGAKYAVAGLVDTALGYQQLGRPDVAFDLLQQAGTKSAAVTPLTKPEEVALLYEALVKAYLQLDDRPRARAAIASYLELSRLIFDAGTTYTGTAHDDLAGKEVDYLLRVAQYLASVGDREAALAVLAEAWATAGKITDAQDKYVLLVGGYANVQAYDQALARALEWDETLKKYLLDTTKRNQAIANLANTYIDRNDFPESVVASIDTDGDGQPDFFHPLATADEIAASGLLLDEDCDGDGIVDTLDLRPLFAD